MPTSNLFIQISNSSHYAHDKYLKKNMLIVIPNCVGVRILFSSMGIESL